MAGTTPWTGARPRRARQLIPAGLPRRGELIAVSAVALLLAHLLLAQLTLVLALAFAAVSKATRWRLWWLAGPAAAGLAWTLAAGPGNAVAGFTAGPAGLLWHLSGGHLAGRDGQPLAGFAGAQHWLPRQLPLALVAGAAEAALIGWLDWLHTDEWAVPPPRPGLIAAARRAIATRVTRAGAVVTREGCALGVVPSTGAIAELRWAETARGALVVGAAAPDVALAGLQVVHAALRRRKPVIVLDPGGDDVIARALAAACRATGTPLLTAGSPGTPAASGLWGRGTGRGLPPDDPPGKPVGVDLGRVVRERAAATLPADSPELAARACGELAALARHLYRIGVDGDALVWVPRGELLPAQALRELLRDGQPAGLAVLIGATAPATAAELSALAGTALIQRVADPELAATLAARTGTWLRPRSPVGQSPVAGEGPAPLVPPASGDSGYPGAAVPAATMTDLVAGPVIPARTLLALRPAEFVLAANWPRPRLIASGVLVPARLPRLAGPQAAPREAP